ncbi:MAG: prepilin-type N-terminal cleavage/methylation domain-containing protein [Fusobacteria bacterium]|nr:prepilin-type N-terminal cleavage/methylation domain-containing protein [Fusobacteriota bacterium]
MKKKGFTLVELLIGIAIIGILIGAVVTTIYNLNKSFQKSTASSLRNEGVITAMNAMERQVERSYYVCKVSNTQIYLKVKPNSRELSDTDTSKKIVKPYLLYLMQSTSNPSELIGYCVGKTVALTDINPTQVAPEIIYDKLNGSGALKFIVLSTNKFYLPETVIFPGQTKIFQYYDEYTNTYNASTQTYSLPGVLIGSKISGTNDTKVVLNISTLGSNNAVMSLTITYLNQTGSFGTTSFSSIRTEAYRDMTITSGAVNAISGSSLANVVSGAFPSTFSDGALKVSLANISTTTQIKLGTNSFIEVPYTITAGKSVVVTLSGKEQASDKSRSVELSNTLTSFEQ